MRNLICNHFYFGTHEIRMQRHVHNINIHCSGNAMKWKAQDDRSSMQLKLCAFFSCVSLLLFKIEKHEPFKIKFKHNADGPICFVLVICWMKERKNYFGSIHSWNLFRCHCLICLLFTFSVLLFYAFFVIPPSSTHSCPFHRLEVPFYLLMGSFQTSRLFNLRSRAFFLLFLFCE